ncbi:MAG: hypothetical protein HRU19_15370 [Pseudobacteriovorax sp.]|nr:hypothetical protein [Pseudobacteriovorax sp.]
MKKALATLAILAASSAAQANTCTGKVEKIAIEAPRTLMVQFDFQTHRTPKAICKLNQETCKLWYPMLLAAKASGTPVSIRTEGSDCRGSAESFSISGINRIDAL